MFKPNYMPRKYAIIILPIAGALISLGAFVAVIEDAVRSKRGTFEVAGGTGSGGGQEAASTTPCRIWAGEEGPGTRTRTTLAGRI